GIGKGYAVDKMAAVLRDAGIRIALISAAGSSIYAMGAPPAETKGWYIRIRDPKDEQKTAGEVWLRDGSLSTSGSYEKFFEADGKIYSHLMDPRTGYPAQGMLEVSVLAPQTIDSEAWTKPCFINGPAWTKEQLPKNFRALLCEDNGKACYWVH
ncbi:MAG TPA: FAD:protein FMN transferase, partial [Bryobacterales bacterium]|nr:FAD:protein FMN transferase [Bryobacterales bacterium]